MPSVTITIIPNGGKINLRRTLEGLGKKLFEVAVEESDGSYRRIQELLGFNHASDVSYRIRRYGLTKKGRRHPPRKKPKQAAVTELLLEVKTSTRHTHKVRLSPRFEGDPSPWVCVIEGCGKRMKR